MINDAYLVLSVGQLREMLAAGELEQKARHSYLDSVTIVLENIVIYGDDGQIASWSIRDSVRKAYAESAQDLANGVPV